MKRAITVFLITLAATVLTSCGGGGTTVAEGGIGGTGVSMGRVTSFGSVFVNGIEYETDASTTFDINGNSGSESDLAVGMVIRLSGSKNNTTFTGTAEAIEYSSLVTGTVDIAYDANTDTFGAMGQTISINTDTVYEGTPTNPTLADLSIGDQVEISGFTDGSSGMILATRVEDKTGVIVSTFEVTGEVVSVPGSSTRFMIGALTIDTNGLHTIPPAGTLVEVESSSAPAGGILTLGSTDSISIVGNGDGTVGDDGEEIEVEGQVTADFDPLTNRFSLNGQVVEVLIPGTEFKDGATTADLVSPRILEVEGTMDGDILLAEEIEVEADELSKEEISGNVTAVVVGSGGSGSITLLGRTVLVTNSTILKSDLPGEETFNLTQLQSAIGDGDTTNDYVEVYVFTDGNGDLVATKIEREVLPGPDHAELEGVSTFSGGILTVLDITIEFSTITPPFTPTDGQRIEVVGTFTGSGPLVATSISPD
ncbi:MAG: hypothetical protein KZQ80_03340 [Candidatus Thiodiazotropha sp. (ex Monitilora ramsayi)]|nr:hypothetical protein [Candidatus Thiodiazotropha sp. (ex Monitilora ramsayi)]